MHILVQWNFLQRCVENRKCTTSTALLQPTLFDVHITMPINVLKPNAISNALSECGTMF